MFIDRQRSEKLLKSDEWPDHYRDGSRDLVSASTLKEGAIDALACADLDRKIRLTRATAKAWYAGSIGQGAGRNVKPPDRPGRPERPVLVPPTRVKKRSIRSEQGRFALLHAIAHIELNAIDLAWDIVARFCDDRLPRSFFDGWVRVALEEAKHFSLLQQRLGELGGTYGDLEAHDGLWEAAQSTDHSLTARLAVVPLILEARGLDITPSLIEQMSEVGDEKSAAIFHIIYRDEQGHVAVGAKWFRFLCHRERRDPAAAFQTLVQKHFRGALKPPFNDSARARAGLTPNLYRALASVSR